MLWLELWDLEYLASKIGVHRDARAFSVLRLRHVEGYSYTAIGAELACSAITAGTTVNRFWRRIKARPWSEREKAYLRAILDVSEHLEDTLLFQEAQTIFLMLRGKRPSAPPSPLYDELGRRVGAPATLFTVGDIYRLLRIRQAREELLRDERMLPVARTG